MKLKNLAIIAIFISMVVTGLFGSASGQSSKTSSRMLYHGGPVFTTTKNIYFIYYGMWGSATGMDGLTAQILSDFASSLGGTPYFAINSSYTDGSGQPASRYLIYGGDAVDGSYLRGVDLTPTDMAKIIEDQIGNFHLPQDANGIYVIATTPDIASTSTGFCWNGASSYHGHGLVYGNDQKFIFLGHPLRCPSVAGGQYFTKDSNGYLTPNGNFPGDAMALNLAHALNGLMTDPEGTGWFDRYGLENADKCKGTFGQTFTTANGALANIHLGYRDFLLEQNWVNDKKGRCALSQ